MVVVVVVEEGVDEVAKLLPHCVFPSAVLG